MKIRVLVTILEQHNILPSCDGFTPRVSTHGLISDLSLPQKDHPTWRQTCDPYAPLTRTQSARCCIWIYGTALPAIYAYLTYVLKASEEGDITAGGTMPCPQKAGRTMMATVKKRKDHGQCPPTSRKGIVWGTKQEDIAHPEQRPPADMLNRMEILWPFIQGTHSAVRSKLHSAALARSLPLQVGSVTLPLFSPQMPIKERGRYICKLGGRKTYTQWRDWVRGGWTAFAQSTPRRLKTSLSREAYVPIHSGQWPEYAPWPWGYVHTDHRQGEVCLLT